MPIDKNQTQEVDLDRTDRLPILDPARFEDAIEDEAVAMEYTASLPTLKHDFPRPLGVDLPSLAESVRSVEDRIARQKADYDALNRAYDKAREAEAAASSRARALEDDLAALRRMREEELAALRAPLEAELAAVRARLEVEHHRTVDNERALALKAAAAESARTRAEDALRDAERYQSESETLRNTLGARDTALADALHSLGERDAQLVALQREHAHLVPALESRVEAGEKLTEEVRAARARVDALAAELEMSRGSVVTLKTKQRIGEAELNSIRAELAETRTQASSYLERLSTREWRRGFDHNMFRELDTQIGAAHDERGALWAEREQLRHQVADLRGQLATRDQSIAQLRTEATEDEALLAKQQHDLQQLDRERAQLLAKLAVAESTGTELIEKAAAREDVIAKLTAAAAANEELRRQHESNLQNLDGARAGLVAQISTLEAERQHLQSELAEKDAALRDSLAAAGSEHERIQAALIADAQEAQALLIADAQEAQALLIADAEKVQASLTSEAQHLKALLTSEAGRLASAVQAAEQSRADLTAEVERLKAESQSRDHEMSALVAQLHEARRPIQSIEAQVRRLTDDLAAKTLTLEALSEENRNLRSTVERTKGALEEREFLIRRLERSESNNANVLGRIQTSIERLGATGTLPGSAAQPVECSAELSRVDGQHNASFTLARRTRIGRAPGCELRVESSSVSRHHALLVLGPREAVIEDLNSTNGVIVNGRKISRQMLNDGDMVTIGEAQFRFTMTLAPRLLDRPAAE